MREMIHLASVEMHTKNAEDIALFFRLFNKILQKVTGNEKYKFNPRCFLCDETRANYKAIRLVYGKEFCTQRVHSCQFHFKQQVQKKKKHEVPEDVREEVIDTCNQLCKVTTVSKYNMLQGKLEEVAARVPQLWWHDRRSHIFGPYRGGGLPGCNLSEQGNAKWHPTQTLRLVHAARDNVSPLIFQQVSVNLFNGNLHKSSGRGRSKSTRDAQDRAQQMNVVNDFIETLNNPQAFFEHIKEILQPSSHIPKGRASFKPSKKKTSKDDSQQNQRNDKRKGRKQKINIPPTSASLDQLEHKAK